ncbi:zinc finger protein DPF3-like isoform X1 [Neocloeon triangulifer]|uniref:zinc finger protein DPF3-like isoform X1 n=1 Tax=Neocloeon triangulifer TaxID=2078957 RepID=UPI00286F0A6F|nr:zinc finger protein DPF3-like isoform X1 [Neocloeon triangulifer]
MRSSKIRAGAATTMASIDALQINPEAVSKLESFLKDPAYKEAIENSATYNTRLCIERRLRMPFLDSQTGVAQNHSNLFMSSRQRLPGVCEGQIYSYPSKRWRKKRRQYLMNWMQPRRKEIENEIDLHTISTVENPAAINEDSKDSMLKDEATKLSQDAWFYDDLDINDIDNFDEPDADSDYDYEESYKRNKRRRNAKTPTRNSQPAGRGRRKITPNYDAVTGDADKPFSCELCGARYKTRPGLTYHYTHSHKDKEEDDDDSGSASLPATSGGGSAASPKPTPPAASAPPGGAASGAPGTPGPPTAAPPSVPAPETAGPNASPGTPRRGRQNLSASGMPNLIPEEPLTPTVVNERRKPPNLTPAEGGVVKDEHNRANPSPYCDFCLGDANENKKTGTSEELVSCSDCGRSGHPSCLQFTANMIISVRKYRWQCIECKCCSVCGTSDNDDQLLFCDDCDRGYHMYCLNPPLTSPPEGTWSCTLCMDEFHKK